MASNVDFDSDDIDYDGRVRLKSGGIMANVYPLGGGFRISGGVRFNDNGGRATATPSGGVYEIGGKSYIAAQVGHWLPLLIARGR